MKEFYLYHKGETCTSFRFRDGLPELEELTTYIIKGKGLAPVKDLITVIMTGDDGEDDLGELNFGNYVGLAPIYGKEFRVVSKKITMEGFSRMLSQVTEEISNLPFDFNTPTFLPFERSSIEDEDVLYQRFAYLRQAVLYDTPSLGEQFQAIEADPHRTMLRVPCESDISCVRNVNYSTVLDTISRPENLERIPVGHPASNLPIALDPRRGTKHKLVPAVVSDERAEMTFDNLENRFLKSFLKDTLLVAEHFAAFLAAEAESDKYRVIGRDLEEEARQVINILERLVSAGFLSDVGTLTHFPASSQILQKSSGYRDFLRHYHHMALASEYPIDPDSYKQIIEGKNIALLYEYWSFFTMARILRTIIGDPVSARIYRTTDSTVGVRNGIKLDYRGEAKLGYNLPYAGSSGSGSYSVGLRPDISLEANRRLHLFDAKFKYERMPFETPQDIEEVEREENTFERFKLGDLYKMHTYRDAIRSANSVWIIYPGTEFRFFEEGRGRLSSIEEIGNLTGVGAVPLKPLGDTRLLDKLVTRILG